MAPEETAVMIRGITGLSQIPLCLIITLFRPEAASKNAFKILPCMSFEILYFTLYSSGFQPVDFEGF